MSVSVPLTIRLVWRQRPVCPRCGVFLSGVACEVWADWLWCRPCLETAIQHCNDIFTVLGSFELRRHTTISTGIHALTPRDGLTGTALEILESIAARTAQQ